MDELRRLVRTDPDPRVRRRAPAVLMLAQGASVRGTARWFRTAPHRVRAWRSWFLDGGRASLADDPRCGRPPKLGAAAIGNDSELPVTNLTRHVNEYEGQHR